jgi:nucleoside-diphosphate-sugar epimerase
MKIFLAGGTGAVGKRLIPVLIKAGHKVVALNLSLRLSARFFCCERYLITITRKLRKS